MHVLARPDRWVAWLIDGFWLLQSCLLAGFVVRFGVNLPYLDEWATVDVLANQRPVLPWLWEWHNDHLLPLPRALYWGLFQLGHDLCLAMLVSAIGWSALCRFMLLTARRLRGHTSVADLLFPLAMLHWGQFENVLMSYQIGFLCSTSFAAWAFGLMCQEPKSWGRVAGIALLLMLLPLCGGHGLLFAAAGCGWLGVIALSAMLQPRIRVTAVIGLSLIALVASLYFWIPGKPVPPVDSSNISFTQFLKCLLGYATVCGGVSGERLWPWSAIVPVATALGIGFVIWRSRNCSWNAERFAWWGCVVFLLAWLLVAVAIAWGRGRTGFHAVFFPRYVAFSMLLPLGAFFLAVRFGGPRWSRIGPMLLMLAFAGLYPVNMGIGYRNGQWVQEIQHSVISDLSAGVPVEVVSRQYHQLIYNNPPFVAAAITRYASTGIGPIQHVTHEPVCNVIECDTVPMRVIDGVALENGGVLSRGKSTALAWTFPKSGVVSAVVIRGRYRYPGFWPPARVRVEYRTADSDVVRTFTRPVFRFPTPELGDPAIIVWVNGPITELRLWPDDPPWGFAVTRLELLVPRDKP